MAILPEGYQDLAARYRVAVPAGASVYEQGVVSTRFYVVLTGRLSFVIVDASGGRSVVREVYPGETLGVVSAFSEHPTSAGAVAEEAATLLAIPVAAAAEAFRIAPALALAIIRELADPDRPRRRPTAQDPADIGAEAVELRKAKRAAPAVEERGGRKGRITLQRAFNDQWFFADEIDCPLCTTRFEYLRVRASAVRPSGRDSDFRIEYSTLDPTLYSVLVCPECGFAAYGDEFRETTEAERRALVAAQKGQARAAQANLCGERSLDDGVRALGLALECYRVRGAGPRRLAGLLHRRAWLERERGDAEAERRLIEETRDAYREVYERDGSLTEEAALRVAYLIGDLTLRLGQTSEGTRWLLLATQLPEAKRQQGLMRMARERLYDAGYTQARSA